MHEIDDFLLEKQLDKILKEIFKDMLFLLGIGRGDRRKEIVRKRKRGRRWVKGNGCKTNERFAILINTSAKAHRLIFA